MKHVPQSAQKALAEGNLKFAIARTAMFPRNIQCGRGIAEGIKAKAAVLEADYDKAAESIKTVTAQQVQALFLRLDSLLSEVYGS